MSDRALRRAASLTCWSGPVAPEPLAGGITNTNFVVRDRGERFVVRIGDDIPVHGIMRFNEAAAARAAHAAGISPEIVHHQPGAMVMRLIEGRTLTEEDVRDPAMLERILPLIRACHDEIPKYLRGPALIFWVFHVNRGYVATALEDGSRMGDRLPRYLGINEALESAVGEIRVVFGHNDLLAANFIDDGDRLWLIDWDYAGYNAGLFDLANLASNNRLSADREDWLLEAYFRRPATDGLRRRLAAMKCASLLRETLWSVVSESRSSLDFDYVAYTEANAARFEAAYQTFRGMPRQP